MDGGFSSVVFISHICFVKWKVKITTSSDLNHHECICVYLIECSQWLWQQTYVFAICVLDYGGCRSVPRGWGGSSSSLHPPPSGRWCAAERSSSGCCSSGHGCMQGRDSSSTSARQGTRDLVWFVSAVAVHWIGFNGRSHVSVECEERQNLVPTAGNKWVVTVSQNASVSCGQMIFLETKLLDRVPASTRLKGLYSDQYRNQDRVKETQ